MPALRVTVQRGLDDLGQSKPGLGKGGGYRRVGFGGGELRVVGGEVVNAACELLFLLSDSRHNRFLAMRNRLLAPHGTDN